MVGEKWKQVSRGKAEDNSLIFTHEHKEYIGNITQQ